MPYESLRRAAEQMALRGPDADGFYVKNGVGLAHRRLKVIDLTGGRQPMEDPQTGVCLTYNGEIYNYKELRTELESKGVVFTTQSDTEVLLHAYIHWGKSCVDRLVGIFSFGIYDPRDELLFLVRDRMGAKPLYFAETREGVAFGSSVAALRHFDGVGAEVDHDALLHYLCTIRTSIGSRTLLKSVKTLEPGTALVLNRKDQSVISFKYWDFPIVPDDSKETPSLEEAVGKTHELVVHAVHEQMVSDVPLGGFLSGGIDSTIITAVASDQREYGAYNVGYSEHDCNEWNFSRSAAEWLDVNCREIHLDSSSFVDVWRFLMEEKGLPLSTPNEVPIYHLAHALKQDYTVALSGEGADEVFGGYTLPYFSSYDFDRARRVAPLGSEMLSESDMALLRLYGQTHLTDHIEHYFLFSSWMTPKLQSALLRPELVGCLPSVQGFYRTLFDRFEGCSTMDKLMHIHARINLEGLLNRVDSSTMSASVEARVPFTDHRIAEYLYHLPDNYRIDWRNESARQQGATLNVAEIDGDDLVESKILLRRAFESKVPEEILTRKKVSFPVPFREWFGGSLHDFAEQALMGSELVATAMQDCVLQEMIDKADDPNYAMYLWPLVNLALWEEHCLKPTYSSFTSSGGSSDAELMERRPVEGATEARGICPASKEL